MTDRYTCAICGKQHQGLVTDWAYTLPDVVWAIQADKRSEAAQFNSDLCRFDERHFIRGVLYVPITTEAARFGWGAWAEVDRATFERYLAIYDRDGSDEPVRTGALANELPPYPGSLGAPVVIAFHDPSTRPSFSLASSDTSRLALEQRAGIDTARHHEILHIIGAPAVR